MSHHQVKQIKKILLFSILTSIVLYFAIFDKENLPKEVITAQKSWMKKFDPEFKQITNKSEFSSWIEKQNSFAPFVKGETNYKTKLETIKIDNQICTWDIYLTVNFGISIKGGEKQYEDKVIVHDTETMKICPNT